MIPAYLMILYLYIPICLYAQAGTDCDKWDPESGTDLLSFDSIPFSLRMVDSGLMESAQMVFCPAGIERSSPNDVKKRNRFEWTVKFNNIYLKTAEGLIFEGMNEHGFSASLMFLNNSSLPDKDRVHIPITASLAVNFFIDHFQCIDTALLAVWDIRIFDDIGLECGWPFRLVLHDSGGSTAYIEYVGGILRVFTPESPALVVSGPDYTRLITLKHVPDSIPKGKAERRFLNILDTNDLAGVSWKLLQHYDENNINFPYGILRDHKNCGLIIMDPDSEQRVYDFRKIGFVPGGEYFEKIF